MALGFLKNMAKYVGAKGAEFILPHVTKHPELLGKLVDRLIARGCDNVREKGAFEPRMEERKINAIKMIGEMIKLHLPRLAPSVQKKLVFNLLYHQITHGEPIREKYKEKYGEWPPTFFAISPSMRCNLRCEGCYAAEYQKYGELTPEKFNSVVQEGKNTFGIHFYTILGGEPTCWPAMWDCVKANPEVFFQIYTHGQSIDEELAKKVADLGNVTFAVSIEGMEAETDARRGPGTYKRIMKSLDILKKAGVMYGFSATHTTKNHAVLASGEFYKAALDAGCAFGWVFQYVPMGRSPNMDLVVSPEQRLERFNALAAFREANPIALFDFWNDGEMTDGCMAYGRRYIHILSSGKVEPCVFVHFIAGDVHENTLEEIVQSPFLKDARSRAPFFGDRRAPCSFLDNPEFIKEMVQKYDLKPSHDGADSIVNELHGPLMARAAEYKKLLKETPSTAK